MQLVMSHVGTDFDGLASMVLAQKLYPGSQLVFPGRKSSGVKEFHDLHKRHFPFMPLKQALAEKPTRLIVVDTRTPSRLGKFRQWLNDSEVELHIYDHHPPTAESVRGDQEWVEPVGAAATLLVERCRKKELPISPEEASLCLIAIHEETGSFRYSSTTARDLEAASYLMERGANLEVVTAFLKDPLSDGQRALLEEFLKNGELVKGTGGSLYLASAKRDEQVYGLGYLATKILDIEGADAVCTVLESKSEGTNVAARAQGEAFNVAAWMVHWGGGGHAKAAAASRIKESAREVCKKLAEFASQSTSTGLTAGDIMSTDLFTIDLSYNAELAYKELTERGFHAACVLGEDGTIQGLVSLTDLNKAMEHKLGHAPAKSVMTHKVVSVHINDTLDQVRRVVVERNVGSLPVLDDNGELKGILTRTDLLRELYQEAEGDNWRESGKGQVIDLSDTPEPFRTWLEVTARLAAEKKIRLYAVGGFVRDLLLGRRNDDLDLVVEGDAIALAARVSEVLGGKLIKHEKYLTASVKFEDGNKLDLATARREVYVRPAALPEVAESKLKSDLYRRDFTVNSLALQVNDQLQGTVIDFFGGRQDLEGKKIRVLHNHSFFDDPTRILRAVRFEQRLGFTIEPHTKQLIKSALESDVFGLTYGDRLAEEIRLSFSEYDPIKVFTRLDKLKILKALSPGVTFHKKVQERIQRALIFQRAYPKLVPRDERWLVPLMLFGFELSDEGRQGLYERFGWQKVPWPTEPDFALGKVGRKKLAPSEVAEILDQYPPIHLVCLVGLAKDSRFGEEAARYVERTREMKPILTGAHFLERGLPQGPQIADWKKRALAAQRDGVFRDEAGALEWLNEEFQNVEQPAPSGN